MFSWYQYFFNHLIYSYNYSHCIYSIAIHLYYSKGIVFIFTCYPCLMFTNWAIFTLQCLFSFSMNFKMISSNTGGIIPARSGNRLATFYPLNYLLSFLANRSNLYHLGGMQSMYFSCNLYACSIDCLTSTLCFTPSFLYCSMLFLLPSLWNCSCSFFSIEFRYSYYFLSYSN